MAFVESSSHLSRWTNFQLWLDVHVLLSNYPTRLIAEQREWPVLVWPSAHAPDEGRNHSTPPWVTNFPHLEKVISSPVSLLFCCLTFGPLTSNALQQLLFLVCCLQSLFPVNPYLTRGLTDAAQGKAVKVATGKQASFVKLKQVTFCALPSLPFFFLSALCWMLICLSHSYSHLRWRCLWESSVSLILSADSRTYMSPLLHIPHGSIQAHQDPVNREPFPSGSPVASVHLSSR